MARQDVGIASQSPILPGTTPALGGVRIALGVGVAMAAGALALRNRGAVDAGGDSLAGADLDWLVLALGLSATLWVAGTASQLGAISVRLPLKQLFGVQVAGSFVNHIVPGGVGGMAVNVRFLQRTGMTRSAAVASVGLNSVATMIAHLLLVAGTWAVAMLVLPSASRPAALSLAGTLTASQGIVSAAFPWIAGALAAMLLTTMVAVAPGPHVVLLPRRVRNAGAAARLHTVREFAAIRSTIKNPGRAALLWTGAAAAPVLHALILVAVVRSLAVGIPASLLILTYLLASALASLVPSPGGFGSLDVLLTVGLVVIGATPATAVAVALGYRLVTVWVPLIPGALVLTLLMRRRVL